MSGDKSSPVSKISQDRRIASLGGRQHGNVARRQLLELGISKTSIEWRLKAGRLHRVHAGVYGVGRPPQTALERSAAAVLACGPGAALSHLSALALWGFAEKGWPSRYDVTVPGDRRPNGIRVHRCTTLARRDVRGRHRIRVTSPARTLLDCAPLLSERARKRAVNDALRSGHLTRSQLGEILARNTLHPGTKLLIPFCEHANDGPTRSLLEDDFLAFCERFDLPRPQVNIQIGGREVDAFFEDENLIVELDGYDYHSSREAFERDRDADADAIAAGRDTVRITVARIRTAPQREAARLDAILKARRASRGSAPARRSPPPT